MLALAEHLMYPNAKMTNDYVSHSLAIFGDQSDFSLWFAGILNFLLTYGFALALLTGVMLYKRYTASELRFVALERAWSDARLSALRAQLSPHTLFNLLHTIRGQVEWDPPAAQAMIVQLGDLLRRLLAAGQRDFSSLRDELQFARLYLELQRKRFSERLLLDLPEGDSAPPYWAPSLILQPLVENAVVHGVAGHEGPVRIALKIVVAGETLKLQVFNTVAPGRPQDGNGIGLKNVAERLAVHFGDKASLNAGPAEGGEWLAEISMPLLHEGPQVRSSGPAS
jgi:sensor histidine kinase YesM